MPRSATSWTSLRQMEYIEDLLVQGRPFQLSQITDYFSCDTSHASMAMSAYRDIGGMLPKRTLGFLQDDGTIRKGALRNGAKAYFIADDDFKPKLGTTPDRIAAWNEISGDESNLDSWFVGRILDYIDDGMTNVSGYFGISDASARHIECEYYAYPGVTGMKRGSTAARRRAWSVWRT